MKFSALFKAPLNYLPFSASTPEKSANTAKKNSPPVKKSSPMRAAKPVQLKPYRGISIVYEDCACDAVKAIENKRFLISDGDAPMLPLPACDASRCSCKYKHYDDRREYDDDRRHSAALQTQLYEDTGNNDRREKKRGRRKTDW
ncbi:Uncharacterised protein [Halioglobus japonicus]|nr:Uncharacterised protein [Halioglobus japonicus]